MPASSPTGPDPESGVSFDLIAFIVPPYGGGGSGFGGQEEMSSLKRNQAKPPVRSETTNGKETHAPRGLPSSSSSFFTRTAPEFSSRVEFKEKRRNAVRSSRAPSARRGKNKIPQKPSLRRGGLLLRVRHLYVLLFSQLERGAVKAPRKHSAVIRVFPLFSAP